MLTPRPPLPPRTTPETTPATLPARAVHQPGGGFNSEFPPPGPGSVLEWLPQRKPVRQPVGIRIGHHFLSSSPKPIDDFSASTLLSALRVLQKVRNLDGPDDIASALPAAFSKADQPYLEIGLLSVLFPLVLVSTVGAVRNALDGYAVQYPAQVRKTLLRQQAMIDALRRDGMTLGRYRVPGETDEDLALLITLQQASTEHFEAWQAQRKRGFVRLVGHNIGNRLHRVRGNGKLSKAFMEEAAEIVVRRMARARILASVEATYQQERLQKADRERHAAKVGRTAALLTGTGMSAMTAGMPVSAAGALAKALAATAAQKALEQATGGVMAGAQAMQLSSGAVQMHLHRRQRQQVARDVAAVQALDEDGDGISEPARRLCLDEAAFEQRTASRGMVFSGLLTGGQGLMLASSVTGFFAPPVAAGLAVPGAVITVAASIGASLNEDHAACHAGAATITPLRDLESIGDLGPRLRRSGLASTTAAIGAGLVAQQAQVEQTRMWNDILQALAGENPMTDAPPWSPLVRRERVAKNNRRRRGRSELGPDCVQALGDLLQRRYPLPFFQRRLADIHLALAREMAAHPHAEFIVRQEDFRQQLLFATLKALSARPDCRGPGLFQDETGRRVNRIHADADFFAYLEANPPAKAVYQQKHNELLARHLTPGHRFARAEHHEALTDLAHTRRKRKAMADPAQLDADAETTWL